MKRTLFRRFLALLLCAAMTAGCTGACAETEEAEAPACAHAATLTREEAGEEASCTTDGSHTVITECADCGEELSRKTVTDPATGHDYRESGRTAATYDADGSVTYTCTRCGKSYSDVLPRLEKPAGKDEEDEKTEEKESGNGQSDEAKTEGGKAEDGESGDGKAEDGESGDGKTKDGESGDGKTEDGESGDGKTGDGESGDGKTEDGESGDGKTGDGESEDGKTEDGESGDGETGDGESGDDKTEGGESGDGETGDGESGEEEPGDGESEEGEPEEGESEDGEPEEGESEDGEPEEEPVDIDGGDPKVLTWKPKDGGADNDELLNAYVERIINAPLRSAKGGLRSANNAGSSLKGIEQAAYAALKARITEIADGNERSTVISLSMSDLGIEDFGPWTASDLGVESIVANNSITDEASDAAYGKITFDLDSVMNALREDCPYELYWYDKTVSVRCSYPRVGARSYGNEWTLYFKNSEGGQLAAGDPAETVSIPVSRDYAGSAEYTVDDDRAGDARAAVARARSIVNQNAGGSVTDRLRAYKEAICDLVSYNTGAAENSSTPYGDPWQLVYVFDGDESTNVVCEGYSKAFKYLCDLDGGITCLTVSGWMSDPGKSERHMWNLVVLEDGSYLTDVTNCDSGTVGAPDKLFMATGPSGQWDEYVFGDLAVGYSYNDNTKAAYSRKRLTVKGTVCPIETEDSEFGTISVTVNGAEAESAAEGSDVTVTVTPAGGAVLLGVTVNGEEITPTDGVYAFVMPAEKVTVAAVWQEAVTAVSASLTLEGQIGLNFRLSIPESIAEAEGTRAVITCKGEDTETPLSGETPVSGREYVFTARVPAKEIADTISIRVADGDGNAYPMINAYDGSTVPDGTLEYSVSRYCESVQDYAEAGQSLKNLCRTLQNYGHYANEYFGGTEETPRVISPENLDTVTAGTLSGYAPSLSGSIEGLSVKAFNLVLESETTLKLRFTADESIDMDRLTVRCGGSVMTPVKSGKSYRLILTNLPAKELDTTYRFEFTYEGSTMTASCSALSYARNALATSTKASLLNTVKAMYLYNQAANAFFGD